MDAEVGALVGRSWPAFPDYIHIINILYQEGLHPRLDYMESDNRLAGTRNFDEFARRAPFSLGELSKAELEKLAAWYHTNPESARRGGAPFR
jgi:hypothetical protein